MSEALSDGLRFINGDDPQSPPEVGLNNSRSASPANSDSNSNKGGRKRGGATEKRVANKVCRVCGDKAFSYNFNVITCESCKAFFRRNAYKENEIRCPFNENCEITKLSRRFCQKCRLTKCFDVGMKKEWIMSEEARLEKKARVEENRERRLQEALAKAGQGGRVTRQSNNNNNNNVRTSSESSNRLSEEPPNVSSFQSMDILNGFQPMDIDDYSNPPPTSPPPAIYHREYTSTVQPINIPMPELPLGSSSPLSHNLVDTVTTQSAHSISDSTAVTEAPSGLNNSPTMTHSLPQAGFRPPTLLETGAVTPAIHQDAIAVSAIAHAQLAAAAQAQVQLQQHAQQMAQAAAVVAATIPTSAIMPQPLPQTPLPPIPTPIPLSIPQAIPSVSLPTVVPSTIVVPSPPQINASLVTITRDVFDRLVQGVNNPQKKEKCVCSCLCGRYAPGTVIVDEVTKDLLDSSVIQCNSCENETGSDKCDPATLETRADLQMNGLLPSESSSVNWISSSTPIPENAIDFSSEAYYNNPSLLEAEISSVKVDPDLCVMVSYDYDRLNELLGANRATWGVPLEGKEKRRHEEQCPDKEEMVNMADGAIRRLIKMSKRIESFRNLTQADQIALIKGNCMEYLILRGAMAYDPNQNAWRGPTQHSGFNIKMDAMKNTEENVLEHSIRFYSTFKEEHRTNDSIMLLLGQIIIFTSDKIKLEEQEAVDKICKGYRRCLKRLLYGLSHGDGSSTLSDYKSLTDKLVTIKDMNRRATAMIREVNANSVEPLILEMLE